MALGWSTPNEMNLAKVEEFLAGNPNVSPDLAAHLRSNPSQWPWIQNEISSTGYVPTDLASLQKRIATGQAMNEGRYGSGGVLTDIANLADTGWVGSDDSGSNNLRGFAENSLAAYYGGQALGGALGGETAAGAAAGEGAAAGTGAGAGVGTGAAMTAEEYAALNGATTFTEGTTLGGAAAGGAAGAGAAGTGAGVGSTLAQLAGPAATLYGAYSGSEAANNAAEISNDATLAATAENRRQFDIGQANLAPWLTAGTGALTEQQKLMGINGYDSANSLAELQSSPGYQFRLKSGQQGLDASSAARGGMGSGKAMTAASGWNQEYASGEYGNRLNQLAGLSGTGRSTGASMADSGSAFANQNANLLMGNATNAGNAAIAGSNARVSGLYGLANLYANR